MDNNSELNARQLQFCREYIVDLNGTKAAIRAGYSERTAAAIAHENLRKPEIRAEIERLAANRATRLEITADRVLEELARIAFADPETEEGRLTLAKGIKFRKGADGKVSSTTIVYRQESRTKALELLARHMLLLGRNDVEGPGGLTIRVVHE